jgi:ABC-type sugar transport system ATPase subunit
MDEPTAALGVAESTLVLDMMRSLKEHGKSVIVITHNLAHIFSVCDRIMVLQHGRKVGERYTRDTSVDEITDMIIGRGQYASNSPKSAA